MKYICMVCQDIIDESEIIVFYCSPDWAYYFCEECSNSKKQLKKLNDMIKQKGEQEMFQRLMNSVPSDI